MSYCNLAVVQALKADKGLALQDLVLGAYDFIATLELTPEARIYLLEQLASTEYVSSPPPTSVLCDADRPAAPFSTTTDTDSVWEATRRSS